MAYSTLAYFVYHQTISDGVTCPGIPASERVFILIKRTCTYNRGAIYETSGKDWKKGNGLLLTFVLLNHIHMCLNQLYPRTWQMLSGQNGGITIPSSVCCVPQIEADTEDFVNVKCFLVINTYERKVTNRKKLNYHTGSVKPSYTGGGSRANIAHSSCLCRANLSLPYQSLAVSCSMKVITFAPEADPDGAEG